MTGAPTIGVTTFNGNIPPSLGREHNKLHNKAIKEPLNSVTGNSFGWCSDFNINFAICGTAKPKNKIGPQKDVVIDVSRPVNISRRVRILVVFTPKLSAYKVPNDNIFNGFIKSKDIKTPNKQSTEKGNNISKETPPKSPNPHII